MAGAIELPLTRIDDIPLVPVSIEGLPPALFELGLGNSSEVLIYETYYAPLHLLESRRSSERLAAGSGGFIVEPVAELRRVQFAGFSFRNMPAAFITTSQAGTVSPKIAGDLGLPVLSRFRLIIDYPHNCVGAVPYGDVTQKALPKDRLGLFVSKGDSGFVVNYVAPGSPAEIAGFAKADIITSINAQPAESFSEAAFDTLRYGQRHRGIVFTLSNGVSHQLLLSDYF